MTRPSKRPRAVTPDRAAPHPRTASTATIAPDLSSRLRTFVDEDSASSWTDYRTLQAEFRGSARIPEGFVAAEYAIEAEDTVGTLFAFARLARPDVEPIRFQWHDDGSGERGIAFAPDDLARMATIFHAIGDVFDALGAQVAADLPGLRAQAAQHRATWTRLNQPELTGGPTYADAAWTAAYADGLHAGASPDAD